MLSGSWLGSQGAIQRSKTIDDGCNTIFFKHSIFIIYGIYTSGMYSFACIKKINKYINNIYIHVAACITFKYTYSYRVSPGTDEVTDCRDLKR